MKLRGLLLTGVFVFLLVCPLIAATDPIAWTTESYRAYSIASGYSTNVGGIVSDSDEQFGPPLPIGTYAYVSDISGLDVYSWSDIYQSGSSYVMQLRGTGNGNTREDASFLGTYTATLPYFQFTYDLSGNKLWFGSSTLSVYDVSNLSSPITLFNQSLSTGTNTFAIGTSLGSNIKVEIISSTWAQNTASSRSLSYSMSTVAPEPVSSILFITGGALLVGRRFIGRKA